MPPKPYAFVVHVSSGRSLFFCVDKEEDARTWTQKMKELVGEEYKPYEYDDTEANARQKYASRPANMLVVTLLRSRGLPAMDSNGKSDPFAELCVQPPKSIIPGRRLAREKPKIKRSKTKKKTLKPNWGQKFKFKVEHLSHVLKVKVSDESNRLLGLVNRGMEKSTFRWQRYRTFLASGNDPFADGSIWKRQQVPCQNRQDRSSKSSPR